MSAKGKNMTPHVDFFGSENMPSLLCQKVSYQSRRPRLAISEVNEDERSGARNMVVQLGVVIPVNGSNMKVAPTLWCYQIQKVFVQKLPCCGETTSDTVFHHFYVL